MQIDCMVCVFVRLDGWVRGVEINNRAQLVLSGMHRHLGIE